MRTLNPSLAVASLVGFLTAASCTLITDVDRTKIPTDAGSEAGAPGTGGTTETGGTAGGGGSVQTGGTAGMETGGGAGSGGEAGQNPTGGTGGESGAGATGGTSGAAGGGSTTPVCDHATGTITLAPLTFIADKDTLTVGDGINPNLVFEFTLNRSDAATGHTAIPFDGTEDQFGLAGLITKAINDQTDTLLVTATFVEAPANNGGGEGGAAGAAGSTAAGADNGGAATGPSVNPATDTAHINLVNDLAGALGNSTSKKKLLAKTVGNPGFKVSGMSGGNAVACASAASCTTDEECASNQCGSDSQCTR